MPKNGVSVAWVPQKVHVKDGKLCVNKIHENIYREKHHSKKPCALAYFIVSRKECGSSREFSLWEENYKNWEMDSDTKSHLLRLQNTIGMIAVIFPPTIPRESYL